MVNLSTPDHITKFVSLLLIEILAFLGNGIMIISGMRSVELRKLSNGFIFNMAVADLLQSMIVMPFTFAAILQGKWPFSSPMCVAIGIIKVVLSMASVQSLAGISLDRYFYIVKNRSAINTKKRIIISICLVWFVAMLLSISPLFGWGEPGFHPGKEVCTILFYKTVSHTFVVFTIGLFVPICIMTICYYKIFRVLRSQGLKLTQSRKLMNISTRKVDVTARDVGCIQSCRDGEVTQSQDDADCKVDRTRNLCDKEATLDVDTKVEDEDKSTTNQIYISKEARSDSIPKLLVEAESSFKRKRRQKLTKKELYLLRSVIFVMLAFICCWLPYVSFNFLRALDLVEANAKIEAVAMWLGFTNSAVNPILYGLTNRQFRDAAKKTLRCRNG